MRFSIRTLLAWTILFAVGFMALREPDEFSLGVVFTLTVQLFLVAAYLVYKRRGIARAFWIAFLASGLAYAVAALGPWFGGPAIAASAPGTTWAVAGSIRLRVALASPSPQPKYRIPTAAALERLADWIAQSRMSDPRTEWKQGVLRWTSLPKLDDPRQAFLQTGHLILSWIAGLLGGTLAAIVISLSGQRKKAAEEADPGATVA